jgi:diguanylate cyclase (GGDEF)-like protein
MNDAPYLLVLLFLVSIVLSLIFRVMWRSLDHARYVQAWSMAYACGAAGFVLNAMGVAFFPDAALYALAPKLQPIVVSYLIMLGYRQRAGLKLHRVVLGTAIVALAVVPLASSQVLLHAGLQQSAAPLFASVMFSMAAMAARRDEVMTASERAAAVVLYLFALFEIALGCLGLRLGRHGDRHALLVYEDVRMMGLPFCYISAGLMGVLVIATDVATKMERLAATDTLTGLMNRRGIERAAEQAMARCRERGRPLTVVLADLDWFKRINDEYGHGAGDLALQRFSSYLRGALPDAGAVGRLGGEEFVLLLEGAAESSAEQVMEEIRAGMDGIAIEDVGGCSLTASFGMTEMTDGDGSLLEMLMRADCALYEAKSAGRNRVHRFDGRERGLKGSLVLRKYRDAIVGT